MPRLKRHPARRRPAGDTAWKRANKKRCLSRMALTYHFRVMVSMVNFLEETAGLVEELVVFGASFSRAGFDSVRPIGQPVKGYRCVTSPVSAVKMSWSWSA